MSEICKTAHKKVTNSSQARRDKNNKDILESD